LDLSAKASKFVIPELYCAFRRTSATTTSSALNKGAVFLFKSASGFNDDNCAVDDDEELVDLSLNPVED
jgi:hypothetical protein